MSKQRKHTKKSTMRKKKRRMAEHAREHQPVAVTAPKTRVKPVVRKYKVTSTNGLYNV